MSLVPRIRYLFGRRGVTNPAIDKFIQSSENKYGSKLEWIPYSEITDITSSPTDNVYYAIYKRRYYYADKIILLSLGSSEECTPTVVSELLEYTHFQRTSMIVIATTSKDIPHGLKSATNS